MAIFNKQHGTGFGFPLVDGNAFNWVSGGEAIAQSLRSILLTEPGERINRETYGAGLRRFLFADNSVSTKALIRQTVMEAIQRDEHRIQLQDVQVFSAEHQETLLKINVTYDLLDQPTTTNLVFDFYLDKGVL